MQIETKESTEVAAQSARGFHRFVEVASLYMFTLLVGLTLYVTGTQLHEDNLLWVVAVLMPFAWMGSDVLTGLIHWMFDTYWSEDTPFLGKAFVQPFREHHTHPKNICHHDLASTVGNSCILGVVLQILLLSWVGHFGIGTLTAICMMYITVTFAGAALTNTFHKWAHADDTPGWIRWLQRMKIILPPDHHEIHHTSPFDTYYCITNGWMNPLLQKIGFFRKLELMLRLVGILPYEEKLAKENAMARQTVQQ